MTDYPNWFAVTAQANFEKFLLPIADERLQAYLQLGAFTGDASVWMHQNVLKNGSTLCDVDTWEGAPNEPIQEQMNFDDVYNTYLSKVKLYTNVYHRKMTTQDYLLSLYNYPTFFDFVYVDAHHTSASAFLDCELVWPFLNPGGILAIDDYEWQHIDGVDIHAPKIGIHMFLDRHEGEFVELVRNQQVWIKKL